MRIGIMVSTILVANCLLVQRDGGAGEAVPPAADLEAGRRFWAFRSPERLAASSTNRSMS